MELRILGSSSSGNSYLFTSQAGETLLVEAGCRFSEVKKALGFVISGVVGCIVSHEHGDHAKYLKDVAAAGIDCYTSAGTIEALGIASHRLHEVFHNKSQKLGSFTVIPFDVKHDARQPFGFIIRHYEMGNCLFLTDSYYSEYMFSNLNQIMIECNYAEDILSANILSGKINPVHADRVRSSHLELNTLIQLLSANDLRAVNNIVLLHLSDGNSDALRFAHKVHEATGKSIHIADRCMTLEFNREPF